MFSTNHEEDWSLDTVDMADGRQAEHGVVGLVGGVGPVVTQPGLVIRPVGDIRDAGHTEDRDEED